MSENVKSLQVRLPVETMKKLDALAKKQKRYRRQVIEVLIDEAYDGITTFDK